MPKNAKAQFIALLTTAGLFGWACGPAAAAIRIEGQVQGGGGPIAKSTVTLWAASPNAPSQLAQVRSDANGMFEISVSGRRVTRPASTLSPQAANRLSIKEREQSRHRLDVSTWQHAAVQGHDQRDDDYRVGMDPRAVPRRHRHQGSRAESAHRCGQRAKHC
jgi:hypothetical protein